MTAALPPEEPEIERALATAFGIPADLMALPTSPGYDEAMERRNSWQRRHFPSLFAGDAARERWGCK